MLSERLAIDVAMSFQLIREFSRNGNVVIEEVATRLVHRELSVPELL